MHITKFWIYRNTLKPVVAAKSNKIIKEIFESIRSKMEILYEVKWKYSYSP